MYLELEHSCISDYILWVYDKFRNTKIDSLSHCLSSDKIMFTMYIIFYVGKYPQHEKDLYSETYYFHYSYREFSICLLICKDIYSYCE